MTPDRRIDDLELRLDKYHEWLEASVEQRLERGVGCPLRPVHTPSLSADPVSRG